MACDSVQAILSKENEKAISDRKKKIIIAKKCKNKKYMQIITLLYVEYWEIFKYIIINLT